MTETPLRPVAPRRNQWVWGNAAVIALAGIVAVVIGPADGTWVLVAQLAVCGAVRLTARSGPPGLVLRSRTVDVATMWTVAAALGLLAATAPTI